MKFIALDLETTWLDTENDGIIEIAALRFRIEGSALGNTIVEEEEHSMLVSPWCPLTQQVSMITNITNSMLEGRKSWDEIRANVQSFIDTGDIFVGHNVLFDIAVLRAHGVRFPEKNWHVQILDTFELAELFSQESESLNLAFLCKKYTLAWDGEHRALDDVKMSLSLLSFYLNREISPYEISVLDFLSQREKVPSSISFFYNLTKIRSRNRWEDFSLFLSSLCKPYDAGSLAQKHVWKESELPFHFHHVHLPHASEAEWKYLKEKIHTWKEPLCLIVPGKEQLSFIQENIHMLGICEADCMEYISHTNLISPAKILLYMNVLEGEWAERKKMIFIAKILFWLAHTKTWKLHELRFYNDEVLFIHDFRSEDEEHNTFTKKLHDTLAQARLILIEARQFFSLSNTPFSYHTRASLREISQYERILRKVKTEIVHLHEILAFFSHEKDAEAIIFALEYVIHALESIPKRQDSWDLFPPWEYGETYSISYEALWGHSVWVALSGRILSEARERELPHAIDEWLQILSEITQFHDSNSSLVITLLRGEITLYRIPRDTREILEVSLKKHFRCVEGYDFWLTGNRMERFFDEHVSHTDDPVPQIVNEQKTVLALSLKGKYRQMTEALQIIFAREKQHDIDHRHMKIEKIWARLQGCTVIVTTGKKYILDIAEEIRKTFGDSHDILAQWVSWGKAKMLFHARSHPEKTILIGLYDTWIDESLLWEKTSHLLLTKIPFDPPSDIYFLGKTVGMKNNFLEYSLPLTIEKLNRLLYRLKASSPNSEVFCLDERLWKNDWWKYVREELWQK